jgi:hypothetical protein
MFRCIVATVKSIGGAAPAAPQSRQLNALASYLGISCCLQDQGNTPAIIETKSFYSGAFKIKA